MNRFLASLFIVLCLSRLPNAFAQTYPADTIHVNINSGNPAYPFPQFNEYSKGKSLAKYNGQGVTHADMEKSMREAYQMMMHRSLYSGQVYNGVKYIQYNTPFVPMNYGTYVSEGDGYALLAAAYLADKTTFDGLWMWVHDNRLSNIKQYYNCTDLRPTFRYGNLPGWNDTEADPANNVAASSASDADEDIALALLIASKQWGDNMGINDACGTPISYKQEALKMIKALVDTLYYTVSAGGAPASTKGYLSGDIGIDGYVKGGNAFGEVTTWRSSSANTFYPWAKAIPDPLSVTTTFGLDYIAPAYYHEFANFLAANGGSAWQINQLKRAEASSDWLIHQMYQKGYIASAGNFSVNIDGTSTSFTPYSFGEDFRASWRTLLNYVWHGNADSTWNPATHQRVAGVNTYEYDMAIRHADFLKFPRTLPSSDAAANCGLLGPSPDPSCPNWKGVVQLKEQYSPTGAVLGNYSTNYMVGTGTPAAVAAGDTDLTAELYRQCEIMWEDANSTLTMTDTTGRYIGSTPKYFHDWFRLLGMLTTSGNLQAPATMSPSANMKVYLSVDKTVAYTGDLVTYTLTYRNYGSAAASGVVLTTLLDNNYQFISATNGGTLSGNKITWNVGTVSGFHSSTGILPTQGTVTFTVKVKSIPSTHLTCLTSTVTASNSPSWTSNQYPNNATYTMQRNCVDLLPAHPLTLTKSVDRIVSNPGDILNVKLTFANQSASTWLNGGRDRVVISYANYLIPSGTSFYQYFRIWHGAHEAYINLANYRVSYFLNDKAAIGLYNASTNPTGWSMSVDNQSDLNKYGYNPLTLPVDRQIKFVHEQIPSGSDVNGTWNQRIITQFGNVLSAPTAHLYNGIDASYLIHKGVTGPVHIRTSLAAHPSSNLTTRLSDDWSYSATVANSNLDGLANRFSPVSPTYTNFGTSFSPVVVNNYSKDVCDANVTNFSKVVVEEYDGYTWRRIAGDGPAVGNPATNVVLYDTIPKNFSWKKFTDSVAVGIQASYSPAPTGAPYTGIVKWTINTLFSGAKDSLSYQIIPLSTCPKADVVVTSSAWISSQTNSPIPSPVSLTISCSPLAPTPPTETSLHKIADKAIVDLGSTLNYSLSFTNLDGSVASWAGTTTTVADWQTIGTNTALPDLNKTTISLDMNSNTSKPGSSGYAFGPKKCHGVNGTIDATISASNASMVSFIYRYASGTPGLANFMGLRLEVTPNPSGPNVINFTLYNNATAIATLTNIPYPGSSSSIAIRTQLLNDKMSIWINNLSGDPLQTISGITQLSAGYVGIYASASQLSLSSWKGHFDSAFDVVISDPIPSQLTSITNISNSGTINGNTIAWPAVPGPVLANAILTRSFGTIVSSCSNFIVNIGQASTYGIPNIQSQNVVNCSGIVTDWTGQGTHSSVAIYPVPFHRTLRLSAQAGIHSMTIQNMSGTTVVQSASGDQSEVELLKELETLPSGLYFIEMQLSNGNKVRQKIVKAED